MKDSHLTLRLPATLARALARAARRRGLPKSALAREAVARFLGPEPVRPSPASGATGAEVAAGWRHLPRLLPAEAAALGSDLEAARAALPPVPVGWE